MARGQDASSEAETLVRDPLFSPTQDTPIDKFESNIVSEQQCQLPKKKPVRMRRSSNVILLNAAAALDGCDDQLLPASFRALESELGFYPSLLGSISLVQTLTLSLSCPFWGYAADRCPRQYVIAVGICCWGMATILLAFASRVLEVFILRGINGVFLGSIGPISQSVLADITPEMARGLQFGIVQMCTSAGRVVGGVITTSVSFLHAGGLSGWRWTFLAIGILSLFLGALIAVLPLNFEREGKRYLVQPNKITSSIAVSDDSAGTGETKSDVQSARFSFAQYEDEKSSSSNFEGAFDHQSARAFFQDVLSQSLLSKSVLYIVVEGMIGVIPWSALSFLTMFMQYVGVTDIEAAMVSGSMLFGTMIAGPIGGFLGDRVHSWSPNHGRVLLGQISMALRVPLLLLAFLVIPQQASSMWMFLTTFLCIGLCSFAGVVVSRPLLSDLVQPGHRATTFGMVVAIEGASAALLGAPGVGFLVEHAFGYIRTTKHVQDLSPKIQKQNALALSRALLCLTALPWFFSFFLYGVIHFTYRADKERIRRKLEGSSKYSHAALLQSEGSMGETPVRRASHRHPVLKEIMLRDVGAGPVFSLCAVIMYIYIKWKPPGIAYTYCWLFYCFLAALTDSPDALALAFCVAFGLNLSWYTSQLVDSLLWVNLIPYWEDFLPHWCLETLIRFGDILLHPTSFILLLPYNRFVDFRIFLYAFLLERWYFILIEGHPFGTGCTTNIVYDFRPHLPQRTFLLSQYLTNLGYFLTAVSQCHLAPLRVFLQIATCFLYIYVCLIHTDRLRGQYSNFIFYKNLVGSALEAPVESYTSQINEMHEDLQRRLIIQVDVLMNQHLDKVWAQLVSLEPLKFSSESFWRALPQNFQFTDKGVLTDEGSLVLWDRLADIYVNLLSHLKAGLPLNLAFPTLELPSMPVFDFPRIPRFSSFDVPSLDSLQVMLPHIDAKNLRITRDFIEAMISAFVPASSTKIASLIESTDMKSIVENSAPTISSQLHNRKAITQMSVTNVGKVPSRTPEPLSPECLVEDSTPLGDMREVTGSQVRKRMSVSRSCVTENDSAFPPITTKIFNQKFENTSTSTKSPTAQKKAAWSETAEALIQLFRAPKNL